MNNALFLILKEKINTYKTLPYFSLIKKTRETEPMVFENGVFGWSDFYQGEIIFVIDNKITGDIRIMGDINDGEKDRVRYSVIISPDGEILSEG